MNKSIDELKSGTVLVASTSVMLIIIAAIIFFAGSMAGCENSGYDLAKKMDPPLAGCYKIGGEWRWNIIVDDINNIYKVEGNCTSPLKRK